MESDDLDDIIRENSSKLHSFVRSRVNNQDDADDIVQDTLYQLVRAVRIMDNPIEKISSWIYTVAHNLIINHAKKHREDEWPRLMSSQNRDYMADLQDIMVASDYDGPDMQMLRSMVWEELHKALAELPPEQREAVELTEIQGLSVKEASELTGMKVNTFLSRKHYAVVHIRQRMRVLYEELVSSHG